MRIGIIGLGTVGQGVVELLRRHRALHVSRCGREIDIAAALVRDASRPRDHVPHGALVTDDPERFFRAEFEILVEVAGGIEPADSHVRRAIESGRDVVTANKALLAARAPALFSLAETHRRRLLFEAAVAGGVPIIRMLTESLASDRVESFAGILNGTCNFILTEMSRGGTYETALKEAQRLGFAEADPTLDVSGDDSLQKLCILASLAFGVPITTDAIPSETVSRGITSLTPGHLADARAAGAAVKLLAFARRRGDAVELFNGPARVPIASPLSRVDGAEMGVRLRGGALPSAFVAGDGAGRFPTASAVVADILAAARLSACRDAAPINPYPATAKPIALRPAPAEFRDGVATLPVL